MKELTIFNYEENEVRCIMDKNNNPWWVAKDICNILGINNNREAISTIYQEDKDLMSFKTGKFSQERKMNVVSESGLYGLIMRSNKPEAKQFKVYN